MAGRLAKSPDYFWKEREFAMSLISQFRVLDNERFVVFVRNCEEEHGSRLTTLNVWHENVNREIQFRLLLKD